MATHTDDLSEETRDDLVCLDGRRRYLVVFGDHDGKAGTQYLGRDSISPEGFPATVLWHDGKGGEQ